MEIETKPSMILAYSKVFEVEFSSTIINSIDPDLKLYLKDSSSEEYPFQGFMCQFIPKGFYKMNHNEITIISDNYLNYNRLSSIFALKNGFVTMSFEEFKDYLKKIGSL